MAEEQRPGKVKQIKIGGPGASAKKRRALAKISKASGSGARIKRKSGRPESSSEGSSNRKITIDKRSRVAARREGFFSKRYKLGKAIGKGGMGSVYHARDTILNMDVALKLLPGKLLKNQEAAERFKREALIVMQLNHEHIMSLHTLEVEKNKMFLVMEYIEGCTLGDILEENPQLSLSAVVDIATCCAQAMDYAHERGVLHKDLKPDNIMLTTDSIIKIIDFGTALTDEDDKEEGVVEGTPTYMSPEQICALDLDARTDVYSLAMVLYECLMGAPAYPYDVTPREVLDYAPSPMTGVDADVAEVIMTGLAGDRDERYNSAGEFVAALAHAVEQAGECSGQIIEPMPDNQDSPSGDLEQAIHS